MPCGPINSIDQVFADPQVRHLGIARTLNGGNREATYVGQPMSLSRTPSAIVAHPPAPGADTDAILAELGFDRDAISDLHARQVV